MVKRTELEAKIKEKNITDVDLAYIAGFFDGEGSVTISSKGGCTGVAVSITSTDDKILSWIQSILGGNVYNQSYHNKLEWNVGGRNVNKWATTYRLMWTNRFDAMNVILLLEPYVKTWKTSREFTLLKRFIESRRERGNYSTLSIDELNIIEQLRSKREWLKETS